MTAVLAATVVLLLGVRLELALVPPRRVATTPRRRSIGRLHGSSRHATSAVLEVAGWCDDVARRLRGGVTLASAVVSTATGHAGPAAALALAVERGVPVSTACADVLHGRVSSAPDAAWRLAIGVVAAVTTIGGPAADALERAARVLRARHADAEDRRVQAAQARASRWVLTMVPVGGVLAMAAASGAVRHELTSRAGVSSTAAGAALAVAGWWWSGAIVGREQP